MHKPRAPQTRTMSGTDWAILLALSVIWGCSFLFIGVAVESVQPFTVVLIRVAIAAAALWVFLLVTGQRIPGFAAAFPAFLFLAFINNVLPFALFAWAQKEIASGLASILNATVPIWGVIVAHFLTDDEKATPAKATGVALGFWGVALMIGPDFLRQIGTGVAAQLACLLATLSYAFASIYARRFKAMGIEPVQVATGQLSAATLLALPLVLLFEPPWAAAAPAPQAWAALTALALLCTSLAYFLYFRLLNSAGATNSLLVTFLIPITAILLGATILGERLEPRHFLGMALIAGGLAAIDGRLLRRLRLA